MLTLAKVLNADLEELLELRLSRAERHNALGYYVSILSHFLSGEKELLERCIQRLLKSNLPERDFLCLFAQTRLEIRKGEITKARLAELEEIVVPPEWEGEKLYIMALGYERLEESKLMSIYYQRASRALSLIGAEKKAVKADLNHISAECWLDPDKKPIPMYEMLYRKAKKAKVFSTAAIALSNISREYQTLGALDVSLSYIQRALVLLDRQKHSRSYFLVIAQRAHILHDLGRVQEARLDYSALRACDYHDLSGVRAILDKVFLGVEKEGPTAPSWQGRGLEFLTNREKLGELEQKVIRFLSAGPKSKLDLVEHLYGDKIDGEVLERRFFSLMTRLKKKLPGAVVFRKGRYELSEEIFQLCSQPA